MLSPVAVSWMIGKSMLEIRFGPISRLVRALGWDNPTFSDPSNCTIYDNGYGCLDLYSFYDDYDFSRLTSHPKRTYKAAEVRFFPPEGLNILDATSINYSHLDKNYF